MDGVDRGRGLWRNLKQRLGFGFCGSSWDLEPSVMNLREDQVPLEEEEEEEEEPVTGPIGQIPAQTGSAPPCTGMNLAAALAAERNPRPAGPTVETPTLTTFRTLMRLFEETDGEDRKRRKRGKDDGDGGGGVDAVCCVCMERSKGAAFIPCGHTYCRVCSREVWLNRGSCPLCNRSITEVLDIF
ncbi:hypothetical protein Vadar_006375 [Vaccinium darrowii]|uniref:Uncharacterized protein n=1 Tax=Vaccinium darrowii TaxID=229202 RepID=A0ACB7XPQ5_9ERIC|nr:hypothetical protein Vadar_006375 [Vaccinium darrowii]